MGVDPPAPAPVPVRKLGVLGAGFMGAGIAGIAAQHGTLVRLKDTDVGRVGRGLAAVRSVLGERLARRGITRQQFADQIILVSGTTDYTGFGNADLVIEAVFEDLDLKHRVLQEVEPALASRRGVRDEHEHDPDHRDRRGRPPSRAGARHALLLARASACRCSR